MNNRILSGLLSLAFALTACTGGSKADTPPATSMGTITAQPAITAARQPGCTVKTQQATPNPTLEAMLPGVSPKDWVQGSAGAYVTIIEYSDFQ